MTVARTKSAVSPLLDVAALSDRGRVRRVNQDCFAIDQDCGFFVVCDGMGGAAGGEIASALAVSAFLSAVQQRSDSRTFPKVALRRGVQQANQAVYAKASLEQRLRGMGSTLVAAHVAEGRATVANVGDSRAYLWRDGRLAQLTQDHSYVAEAVRAGKMTAVEAGRSAMQSVITRAVGTDPSVDCDLYEVDLSAGDALLLASDGLTRHVTDADLASILATTVLAVEQCRQLIALANARGGSDNITCILLRFGSAAA